MQNPWDQVPPSVLETFAPVDGERLFRKFGSAAVAANREAAELMGIDQPKVSAMLAGQFRGYSVERLMRFLVALGHDVEIVVKPRTHSAAELRVA